MPLELIVPVLVGAMRDHDSEKRYAARPRLAMRSMSSSYRRYWSAAGSPFDPSRTVPARAANVSHTEGVRPSAASDPSTW